MVLNGLDGPITVNGVNYNATMPGLYYLNDGEVADILLFVMNSWGKGGGDDGLFTYEYANMFLTRDDLRTDCADCTQSSCS